MADTFEEKTIRDPLLGMVADYLGKGQINCGLTLQVGCELVALLSAYREENSGKDATGSSRGIQEGDVVLSRHERNDLRDKPVAFPFAAG